MVDEEYLNELESSLREIEDIYDGFFEAVEIAGREGGDELKRLDQRKVKIHRDYTEVDMVLDDFFGFLVEYHDGHYYSPVMLEIRDNEEGHELRLEKDEWQDTFKASWKVDEAEAKKNILSGLEEVAENPEEKAEEYAQNLKERIAERERKKKEIREQRRKKQEIQQKKEELIGEAEDYGVKDLIED